MHRNAPCQNLLIQALNVKDRRLVLDKTRKVEMELKSRLYDKNKKITKIYFPLTGVYSIVGDTKDGRTAEVATVGNAFTAPIPFPSTVSYNRTIP